MSPTHPPPSGYCLGNVVNVDEWGVVYEAIRSKDEATVWAKVITLRPEEESSMARILEPLHEAKRIDHPRTQRVLDIVSDDGRYWVVYEPICGVSVRAHWRNMAKKRGIGGIELEFDPDNDGLPSWCLILGTRVRIVRHPPISLRATIKILRSTACVLEAIHAIGIAHGSLDLNRIHITHDGTVLIRDFGGWGPERFIRSQGTSGLIGSAYYADPYSWGDTSTKPGMLQDLYALGIIAYELLTWGRVRTRYQEQHEALSALYNGNLAPPSSVAPAIQPALDEAIMRAIDPRPVSRGTLRDFLRALDLGSSVPS